MVRYERIAGYSRGSYKCMERSTVMSGSPGVMAKADAVILGVWE